MIRKIRIEGFKSIVSQELELGRVNCLIGANGCGKSNILEAIGLLGAAVRGRVDDEALLRRGVRPGSPVLYRTSFRSVAERRSIILTAGTDEAASYRVALVPSKPRSNAAWAFENESLSVDGTEQFGRNAATPTGDPGAGLIAAKRFDIGLGSPMGLLVEALGSFAIYSPNTPVLRATVPDPQVREPVGLAGGGLAGGMESLMTALVDKEPEEDGEADREVFEGIIELLDWVGDMDVANSAGEALSSSLLRGARVIRFNDRFMGAERKQITAYDASEGALYVLFTAILCIVSGSPSIFAIDNLDQALNPRLVTRLVGRLSRWLKRGDRSRQLLFTAHNPAVLDGLDLNDDEVRLFAVDRNTDGHTVCRRIVPTPDLLALNEKYPLSRLWPMGHLGAVPNV